MPPVLRALVKRLVRWGVLPKSKEPDSAIVNLYDMDDCIPPHIDHHDFDRPFCTISLVSQQSIMFGAKLIPLAPGEFTGSNCFIPLPVGSCLVLKGNGADLAMHCVPPVTERRISITLRHMGAAHADLVKEKAARDLALHPSPFYTSVMAARAAGIPALMQTGTWALASEEEEREELEVERRRMRPHPYRLADMWPYFKV
eukprot:jgi/Botrbrau1/2353/Bobra.39_1s0038.2